MRQLNQINSTYTATDRHTEPVITRIVSHHQTCDHARP